MFDPIFDLLAGLLSWFYDVLPSYGFAIIALTTLVLLVFAPLTYKSTKSMLAMRRVQPEVKRLQRRHKDDREKLNQEMMALYSEHGVSPLSGCLPILVQSPVFFIMFRVIRGITRRYSGIGYRAGESTWFAESPANLDAFVASDIPLRGFNPEYLDESSAMRQSLVGQSEMNWIGIDLSRTPFEVVRESFASSLPYLLMVAIVAVLGVYQQRQLAGRSTGEISSQQQMIMRVIPWMLPIFSFTMPAALVLYFMVSSTLRILQQAYITRTVYGDEALTTPIEVEPDDLDDLDDSDGDVDESPLAQLFGGSGLGGGRGKSDKADTASSGSSRHGSRRPTSSSATKKSSSANRSRPPRDTVAEPKQSSRTTKPSAKNTTKNSTRTSSRSSGKSTDNGTSGTGSSIWSRAKRSAPTSEEPPTKTNTSRRVTPKGENSSSGRRNRK